MLLVNGLALTGAEIERLCDDIRELYPEYSLLHARRLALTNEFLPRLAVRAMSAEPWLQARAACEAARPELEQAGQPSLLATKRIEGRFKLLGIGLWSAARHLSLGEWSEPIELTGRWLRLRLEARSQSADPLLETLELSLLEFPFVPLEDAERAVQAAIDRAHLTLLDADFAEAVPETWKHRMRGSPP
ncbi:MAG: hypothetical protein HOP15_17570 [Planctomycetes bacterium]|nr:hypothetical protein [Planctomycetota bacterium]